MNAVTLELLRLRFERCADCHLNLLPSACRQLVKFLDSHPLLAPIVTDLRAQAPPQANRLDGLVPYLKETRHGLQNNPARIEAESYEAQAAVFLRAMEVLGHASEQLPHDRYPITVRFVAEMVTGVKDASQNSLELFRRNVPRGLQRYMEERLLQQSSVYGLLRRYARKSSWLRRKRLRGIAANGPEGQKGEHALRIDALEYLADRAVDFEIELQTPSGLADMRLRSSDGQRLIVEAKYIPPASTPSKVKAAVRSGFNQAADYARDCQQSSAFLLVYRERPSRLVVEVDEVDGHEFVVVGGRQVFFVEVDISSDKSASKRAAGQVEVTKKYIVGEAGE